MCINCEKRDDYRKILNNCKILLRAVTDFLKEMDEKICDNVLIDDNNCTYILSYDSMPDLEEESE